jgi:hypothetical protein
MERRTPLKRTPFVRRRPKQSKTAARSSGSDFHPSVRGIIERRSLGQCEVGVVGCTGKAHHIHHILRRSQGGTGEADNGLHVCSSCHHFIHSNPQYAYENGWLRRSGGPNT